jgi:uncharacterized membrane protein
MRTSSLPWWAYLCPAVALIAATAALDHLPPTMAVHFDAAGHPDAFLPRLAGAFMLPGMMTVLVALWHVLWRMDPRRQAYAHFWSTYRVVGGLLQAFLLAISLWVLARNLGFGIAGPRWLGLFVGLLWLLLANLLPRVEPNWWMGVRTPWTLSDPAVWRATHRFAGNLGVAAGLGLVAALVVLPDRWLAWVTLGAVGAWALAAVVASYWFYAVRHPNG